jgi:hypothetical protein
MFCGKLVAHRTEFPTEKLPSYFITNIAGVVGGAFTVLKSTDLLEALLPMKIQFWLMTVIGIPRVSCISASKCTGCRKDFCTSTILQLRATLSPDIPEST